jgi:hypothetical protein
VSETSTATQQSPQCQERYILQGRLRADAKVYIDANRRLESCKPEDFKKTYEAAESARIAFLRAQEALNAHIAAHGCEQ